MQDMSDNNCVKNIILTRSDIYNKLAIAELAKYGLKSTNCDLINYKNLNFDYRNIRQNRIVILTSRYASDIFPTKDYFGFKLNLLVVGVESANILKIKGHKLLFCAKNVAELLSYIEKIKNPDNSYIYLSGNHITQELPKYIERFITYNVFYRSHMNELQIKAFEEQPSYIMVYSQNSAKTLLSLLCKNKLLKYIVNTTIITISNKVKDIIDDYVYEVIVKNTHFDMMNYVIKDNFVD